MSSLNILCFFFCDIKKTDTEKERERERRRQKEKKRQISKILPKKGQKKILISKKKTEIVFSFLLFFFCFFSMLYTIFMFTLFLLFFSFPLFCFCNISRRIFVHWNCVFFLCSMKWKNFKDKNVWNELKWSETER